MSGKRDPFNWLRVTSRVRKRWPPPQVAPQAPQQWLIKPDCGSHGQNMPKQFFWTLVMPSDGRTSAMEIMIPYFKSYDHSQHGPAETHRVPMLMFHFDWISPSWLDHRLHPEWCISWMVVGWCYSLQLTGFHNWVRKLEASMNSLNWLTVYWQELVIGITGTVWYLEPGM